MKYPYRQQLLATGVCVAMAVLAGCAQTPSKYGSDVAALNLLGPGYAALANNTAPAKPSTFLSADDATRLMLLHSPKVRGLLASAGVADAQRAQAGLIGNPKFATGALRPEGGGRWQLDFGLTQSLVDVFTRGLRQQLAEQQWLENQWKIQQGLQSLVGELQHNWFSAIAAEQVRQLREVQFQASQARVTLAQSLYEAGNIPESVLLLHQLDASQQQSSLEKAALAASAKKLTLAYLLGLAAADVPTLPAALATIPDESWQTESLVAEGKTHQPLLLLLAEQEQQLQQQSKLTGQTTWREISVGIEVEREFDGSWNKGGHVEWGLPLFDQGQYRQQATSALLVQNQAQQADANLKLVQQVAASLEQMRYARTAETRAVSAAGIASKRLELLQREVNFMISSPFELLTGKQHILQFEEESILARESYWLARSNLEQALGKQLPAPEVAATPVAQPQENEAHHNHHHHGAHHHD